MSMNDKEIFEKLEEEITNGNLITDGFLIATPDGQPLLVFLQEDDSKMVGLGTPRGVMVYKKAEKLQEFCKTHTVKNIKREMDFMLNMGVAAGKTQIIAS